MEENKIRHSTITKVGPIFKIEGYISIPPFKSRALQGYDESKILSNSQPFIESINSLTAEWFNKFPDCCSAHKELEDFSNFNKEDYSFIPNQILNNVKYFAYALEMFVDKASWLDEITDYMEYLLQSFGEPEIGGHIFKKALIYLIENVKLDNKNFTDDQRLELLQYFEPTVSPIDDLGDRDLDVLYTTFQKWVLAMPNIGKFKEFKERFEGKIPLELFFAEMRFNKYLGISKSKSRSCEELLHFLFAITEDILKLSHEEVKKDNYNKEYLITAAEDRLRIKQDKLLNKGKSEIEVAYLELLEHWLTIVIEFYQVINQVVAESNNQLLSTGFKELKTDVKDILSQTDELKIEISALCNSQKITKWLHKNLNKESFMSLFEEIDKTENNSEENVKLLNLITSQIETKNNSLIRVDEFANKMNDSEISQKHKLKFSIPLFLFTRYESEIELGNKQKMPKSISELMSLFRK